MLSTCHKRDFTYCAAKDQHKFGDGYCRRHLSEYCEGNLIMVSMGLVVVLKKVVRELTGTDFWASGHSSWTFDVRREYTEDEDKQLS